MKLEEYIQNNCDICPKCKSTTYIEKYDFDYRGSQITFYATCGDCDVKWQEEFRLVHIEIDE